MVDATRPIYLKGYGAPGDSALVIAQRTGVIGPNATDQDFVDWLADLKTGATDEITVSTFGANLVASNDAVAGTTIITANGWLIPGTVVGSGRGAAREDAGLEVQHDGTGHALISIYQSQIGVHADPGGQGATQEESGLVFMGRDAGGTICHMGSLSSIWASATAGTARMCMRIASTYNSGANENTDIAIYGGQGMVIFSPINGSDLVGPGAAPGPNQLGIIGSVGIGANPVAKPAGAGYYLYIEGYGSMLSMRTGVGATSNEVIYCRMGVDGSPALIGDLMWGIEGHNGGEILAGSAAYDVCFNSPGGADIRFGSHGVGSFAIQGTAGTAGLFALIGNSAVNVAADAITFGTGNAPALHDPAPAKYWKIAIAGTKYYIPLWQAA